MANKVIVKSGGLIIKGGGLGLGSLASLVTLAFVIAKLAGAISWSWLVVFAPVLAYMALGVVIIVGVLFVIGIGILIGYLKLKNLVKGQRSAERTQTE